MGDPTELRSSRLGQIFGPKGYRESLVPGNPPNNHWWLLIQPHLVRGKRKLPNNAFFDDGRQDWTWTERLEIFLALEKSDSITLLPFLTVNSFLIYFGQSLNIEQGTHAKFFSRLKDIPDIKLLIPRSWLWLKPDESDAKKFNWWWILTKKLKIRD